MAFRLQYKLFPCILYDVQYSCENLAHTSSILHATSVSFFISRHEDFHAITEGLIGPIELYDASVLVGYGILYEDQRYASDVPFMTSESITGAFDTESCAIWCICPTSFQWCNASIVLFHQLYAEEEVI